MRQEARHSYEFGPFRLDATERLLLRNGRPIAITPKAFDTLLVLVENSGHLIEKEELLKQIWPDTFVEEATLARNIFVLRKALGDAQDEPQYIETVPKRGYRFIAPVKELEGARLGVAEAGSPQPPSGQAGQALSEATAAEGLAISARRSRALRIWIGALALAAFLGAMAHFAWQRYWTRANSPSRKIMLAVLPFENLSADREQEYFSDGLTEEMITQLGRMHPERLGVIARTSAMQYKNTQKRTDQIGRELGVDYILEGSVRLSRPEASGGPKGRAGTRVRISAQLIQVSDQTHLWAESYERDLRDILALQTEVARAIANQIRVKLTPQHQARLANLHPVNPEAYELYLKGRHFWNTRSREGLQKAIEHFERAIKKEPNYALAYAGLADSYILLGPNNVRPPKEVYPQAQAAAVKALEMDETLAEAHTSLAFVKLLYEWNGQEAEKEFQRAMELSPNYPTSHHWYAYALASLGRMDEALGEIKRAQELDPLSLTINSDVAQILFFAGRYDEGIEQCRRTLDLDPNFGPAYWYLGLLYEEKGMEKEAAAAFLKQARLAGGSAETATALEKASQAQGIKGYWRKLLELWKKKSKEGTPPAFNWAVACARAGDKDQALKHLEMAYRERHPSMVFVKVEPVFASLRSDPRFADLLRRIGLSQEENRK